MKMGLYAAEIYRLQEDHSDVPLSAIADQVDVSLQAASRMINRLVEKGILTRKPYQGVRLTPQGETMAMPVIRRHRLIEVFLVQVMGFGWDEVHGLADHFEQGINEILEDRAFELAGRPERCPHGEPIPSKDGVMPHIEDVPLTMLEPGSQATISRIKAHEPEKLRYFARLNMRPGTPMRLVDQAPFNGPMRIAIEKHEHVIGYDLAQEVRVSLP